MVVFKLQSAAINLLRDFDLRLGEIKLMQIATRTVIAGSTVVSLMVGPEIFKPGDIDFYMYTPVDLGYHVARFLRLSPNYTLEKVEHSYDEMSGIRKVYTLVHRHTGKKINVVETETDNPLDCVVRFHLSCVFGTWTERGLSHAYPGTTLAARTTATPASLPLGAQLKRRQTVWRIRKKYQRRGFSFDLNEHIEPHVCGVDWNCPATLRTSDDGGCMFTPFPRSEFDVDVEPEHVTRWTLGGTGCTAGILSFSKCGDSVCNSYGE
ncbi:hypothetical protein C8J57DRAFT_1244919 [Mycena rebaudengoi]|nr:hypothetical protein C8J57DRAFT_1244919 [Mycena rebaudengoi]